MSHIVDSCLLTKLTGGLSKLHSADDDDAVVWLNPTMAAHRGCTHNNNIEGRMKGNATQGRKRMHLLSDLMKGKYVALKRTADDRKESQIFDETYSSVG